MAPLLKTFYVQFSSLLYIFFGATWTLHDNESNYKSNAKRKPVPLRFSVFSDNVSIHDLELSPDHHYCRYYLDVRIGVDSIVLSPCCVVEVKSKTLCLWFGSRVRSLP